MSHFPILKEYVEELDLTVQKVDEEKELLVVNNIKYSGAIEGMIMDIEGDVLVVVQSIFDLKDPKYEGLLNNLDFYQELLRCNGLFEGPGAFVLDETDVLFRAILPVENLDLNELRATVISLDRGLADWACKFEKFVIGGNVA